MSNIKRLVSDEITSTLDSILTGTELEVYSFSINMRDTKKVTDDVLVELDRDGDLYIEVTIPEEELCEFITPDVMKTYLIENGYLEE